MTIKIFISSKLTANFLCPECGRSEQRDVSKFIGHKTRVKLKYKCRCQHRFSVILERRRSIRKEVRLNGHFSRNSESYDLIIEDLSKNGIGLKASKKLPVKIGENINISFILDDPNKSKVSRTVQVKNIISSTQIGCEFLSTDHHGSLGKYFLFYY